MGKVSGARSLANKPREVVSLLDWNGVDLSGSTDMAAILVEARTQSETAKMPLEIPYGILRVDSAVNIDVGLSSFLCKGTHFDCTNLAAGNAFNVYSSLTFPALANSANTIGGFTMSCGKTAGRNAIQFGHATNDQAGQINIRNVGIGGFDQQLKYINNAWRINHSIMRLENPLSYYIYYPGSTLTNSGEVMSFDHVMIADGEAKLYWDSHQADFNRCSILNALAEFHNDCRVNLFGCNIENPANTGAGYRMLKLVHSESLVNIHGGRLVINDPGGGVTWDNVPFENAGTLNLFGMQIPSGGAFFKPENDAAWGNQRLLVGGGGRVTSQGLHTFSGLAGNPDLVISESLNIVRNGNAETGATTPWTQTDYGSGAAATFAANAPSARKGAFGFEVDCVANTRGTEITQILPCRVGDYVTANIWLNRLAGVITLNLRCRDVGGNVIESAGVVINSGTGYTLYDFGIDSIPPGTVDVKVEINANVDAAITHFYFDDVIVNFG